MLWAIGDQTWSDLGGDPKNAELEVVRMALTTLLAVEVCSEETIYHSIMLPRSYGLYSKAVFPLSEEEEEEEEDAMDISD